MTVRLWHPDTPRTITSISAEICKGNSTRVVQCSNTTFHTLDSQSDSIPGGPADTQHSQPSPSTTPKAHSRSLLYVSSARPNHRTLCLWVPSSKLKLEENHRQWVTSLEYHYGRRNIELAKLTLFSFKDFFIPLPLQFHFQHSGNWLINQSL